MGLLREPFSSQNISQRAGIEGLGASGQEPSSGIPLRKFGRHEVKVSALGFGGHHLGDAENVQVAMRLVQEAVDNGITFFDNCWEYHVGKSEDWMGRGLKGAAGQSIPDDEGVHAWAGSNARIANVGAVFAAPANGSSGPLADSRREFRE